MKYLQPFLRLTLKVLTLKTERGISPYGLGGKDGN